MLSLGRQELIMLPVILGIWIVPIVLVICAFVILKRIRDDQREFKSKLQAIERSLNQV